MMTKMPSCAAKPQFIIAAMNAKGYKEVDLGHDYQGYEVYSTSVSKVKKAYLNIFGAAISKLSLPKVDNPDLTEKYDIIYLP